MSTITVKVTHPYPTFVDYWSGDGGVTWVRTSEHFGTRCRGYSSPELDFDDELLTQADVGLIKWEIFNPKGDMVETRYASISLEDLTISVSPTSLTLQAS